MPEAEHRGLAGVDLNLLVALDALLSTQSVTLAGQRVGLSQPAMSRALGRLRDLLKDSLLVRDGARMVLTPRAKALAPKVAALLDEVQATLREDEGFDPGADARTFRIATNDFCGALLLPALGRRLAASAPNVDLAVRALGAEIPAEDLAEGRLDVAVGTFLEDPAPLRSEVLFDDGFACLVGRRPPRGAARLDLEAYAQARHALIAAPRDGPGVVDHALAAIGRRRRVVLRVPHFLVAPRLVADSDLVLTLPSRLARRAAADFGLFVLEPPLELPRFEVRAAWHERVAQDAGVTWLLERLREVSRAPGCGPG